MQPVGQSADSRVVNVHHEAGATFATSQAIDTSFYFLVQRHHQCIYFYRFHPFQEQLEVFIFFGMAGCISFQVFMVDL